VTNSISSGCTLLPLGFPPGNGVLDAAVASSAHRSKLWPVSIKAKAPTVRDPAAVNRRQHHRYKCSRCKDVLRVKIKGQRGVSEQCPACHPKQTSAAGKAELLLDSLMLPGLPKLSASRAIFRGKLGKS
jgi:hypothetical protein